jgi:hypothetical protein
MGELDDEIKRAELEKIQAETEKIREETRNIPKNAKAETLSEGIKIFAGIVIGIGGLVAALTGIEVVEQRAENARQTMLYAEDAAKRAELAAQRANTIRAKAMKEKAEAEAYAAQLRQSFAEQTNADRSANPGQIKPPLVYVQFRGDTERGDMDKLLEHLKSAGFQAPGAERKAGNYSPSVRYFSKDDIAEANRLAEVTAKYLSSINCPLSISVSEAHSTQSTSPLELWLPININKCKASISAQSKLKQAIRAIRI